MPVFNAKDKIKSGKLRPEDVPVSTIKPKLVQIVTDFLTLPSSLSEFYQQYMQRGGSWDNSDIRGAKNKKKWLKSDKDYASGGFRKEQSVSIFGIGEGLDWTGKNGRTGPSESIPGAAPKFGKNYKPPNVKNIKKGGDDKPKKKFGWF